MTKKEYKRVCRIKVNHISKFITYLLLMFFFFIAEFVALNGYYTAAVGTTIWFYMPNLAAYLLESIYKLKHDLFSAR